MMKKRALSTKRTSQPLAPARTILVLEGDRISCLDSVHVSADRVGQKAFGLASIPAEWSKPFFVVGGDSKPESAALMKALAMSGIASDSKLLVRSSGTHEDIESRGALESAECEQTNLFEQIENLCEAAGNGTRVNWVVQELVRHRAKGHLSNERRIAEAKRDWVAEIEAGPAPEGEIHRISLRPWRDERPPVEGPLRCMHREALVACLSNVARWTYARRIRVHYEWVWNGKCIYVVQADSCDEITHGQDPRRLVMQAKPIAVPLAKLQVFRAATAEDFRTYRKLANAKLYTDLGYAAVPFYVLDAATEMDKLVSGGHCSVALLRDLAHLTQQPLVLRTDGRNTPKHLREMLPRSDELRSVEAAKAWLEQKFRDKVQLRTDAGESLSDSRLCLIAHHFVPAVASAWCQAMPDQRRVRIESLWGLPEGLYWYSYDVFDVDTQEVSATNIAARPRRMFFREKRRYKEHFIAPDREGAWVLHRTSSNSDWARSITRSEWIEEVAWTTRCIASNERRPVVVMWLIDTAEGMTPHRVLPWYHQEWKQEGPILKAAPRKKIASSDEVVIGTRREWTTIQTRIDAGDTVARIRVDPREPELVRDQQFVSTLAAFARKHCIVIELKGGILSHAYYMLSRAGCVVECSNLDDFASDDEAIEYNKLVRDRIPASIQARGEQIAVTRVLGEALVAVLRRKLVEEAFEVLDARTTEQIAEELADVSEVVLSLMRELDITESDVETARRAKLRKRGGFANGLMLGRTAVNSSLGSGVYPLGDLLGDAPFAPTQTLSRAIELPLTASEEIHVDLRHNVTGTAERQLTATLPAHAAGFLPPRVSFNLETQDGLAHEVVASIELTRSGSDLRVRIRLVNSPKQSPLDLEDPDKPMGQ